MMIYMKVKTLNCKELPYLTLPLYTLNTQDITFALTQTRTHTLCGYTIIGTETLYFRNAKVTPSKPKQQRQSTI